MISGTLKILTSVIEPVKGYRRGRQQPAMTTLGPLTHLVDAVTADSAGAREVSRLIGGLLDDAPRFAEGRETLAARFRIWRDAQPVLDALIDRAPALREAAPLAAHLSAMGQVGLEALTYLESHGVPLPAWQASARATLDAAAQPAGALEFPFVPAMRELTTAAAEQGALSSMSGPDWRKHVQELAAPPPSNRAGG